MIGIKCKALNYCFVENSKQEGDLSVSTMV